MMTMNRAGGLLIASMVCCVSLLEAQNPSSIPLSSSFPIDTAVTVGVLPNGLHYYVRTNAKPEKRAELRLVVNAGSVLEDDDQRGLAHFVEHMAFNGSRHFAKQELVDYLESIGVRFGPDLNASTSFDVTAYRLQIPTDTPSIVLRGFQILEDWAHEVTFADKDIDKERGVIMEEWRIGRGAGARVRDKQLPVLFAGSKYADRLPIGLPEVIQHAPYDAVRRFYHDWYRPDLMAVIAVGDFDKAQIIDLITKHFSALPSPHPERPRSTVPVPPHAGTLYSTVTDPELTTTDVEVYCNRPDEPDTLVRDYRRQIVEGLFLTMLNRRLEEMTRKPNPPFVYGYVSQGRIVRGENSFIFGSEVRDGGIEHGLSAVVTEAERVRRFGFTEGELNRTKSEMLREMEASEREKDKTESSALVNEYIRNFLDKEPIPGISFELGLYRRFLPEISLKEVNAVGSAWISKENRVVMVTAPAAAAGSIPTNDALARILDKADTVAISPYVDSTATAPLLATPPTPGSIVSSKEIKELGVTELTLSNGARVVLKPTTFKNDEILFSSFRMGGTSLADDSAYIPALTAGIVEDQSGIGNFDRTMLDKKLAGKLVDVHPSFSDVMEGVGGSASPQDLATMFQLVYLTMTAPRGDTTALNAYRERMHAMLINRSARPESAYEDTIQVTMAQHNYRSRPFTAPMLAELNVARSLAFYRARFANTGEFVFFIVGNVAVDSIKPYVQTYLASLPANGVKESWKDRGITPPPGVVVKTVKRGMEQKSQVRIIFSGPFQWTQENRVAIGALSDVLRIRLREVLREEKGGTYGVGVGAAPSKIPAERYRFSISFGCNPDRVEELTRLVFDEIDSLKARGPNVTLLDKVRETELREREVSLKQNGFWLNALVMCYSNDMDPLSILRVGDVVAAMKPETVRDAARRYLDTTHYARFVLLPEPKATP